MSKKAVRLILFALPFMLNACSKQEKGTEPSQFEMTGIHDVILDTSSRNMLLISINQTSGKPEPVDINVFGLPVSTPPLIIKKNGIPDFNSEIYFFRGGPPGIYRVKVTASSAHCYREDSLLVFAPGNDFTINGIRDVSLNNITNTDTMSVIVAYVSGNREDVNLSLSAGPLIKGVRIYIQPSSGPLDFKSKIIFTDTPSVTNPGTYPIKIIGKNSSYSKSYEMNLTIH